MPGIKSRKKNALLSSPDVSQNKRKRLDDDIFDDIDNDDEIEDGSMFGQVVKEAGMTLKAGTDPHVLDCDKVGNSIFLYILLCILNRCISFRPFFSERSRKTCRLTPTFRII